MRPNIASRYRSYCHTALELLKKKTSHDNRIVVRFCNSLNKAIIQQDKDLVKATGSAKATTVQGQDEGEIVLFLQHRWEDADGNLFAYRVGTTSERITQSIPTWQMSSQANR